MRARERGKKCQQFHAVKNLSPLEATGLCLLGRAPLRSGRRKGETREDLIVSVPPCERETIFAYPSRKKKRPFLEPQQGPIRHRR